MKGTIITVDTNDATHVSLDFQGALVSTASLRFGDLKAICQDGNVLLFERKAPRDFLDSIKDGRLFNQVAGMVAQADFAYVIVTGFFQIEGSNVAYTHDGYWLNTNWDWHTLQGVLISIQEMGCAVVYDTDYADAIRRIVNRGRDDVKILARRNAYIFTPAENVLAALPGIGSKKATDIMQEFPTVGYALEWLSNTKIELPKISGIGKKTKEKINEFLGGEIELKL